MSTDRPTPEAVGPHLDELATSAALDGEATMEEQAHLDRCAACRAGVERLRAVQARLAATAAEAPDPARRERAIAAALAASEPHRAAPLPPALRTGHRRRRRNADLAPWLGVAAVVLVVALALPLLSRLGGDDAEDSAATSAVEEAGGGAADESAMGAPAPPVDVGDLGPLAAGSDLRPVVDRALGDGDAGAGPSAAGEEGGGDGGGSGGGSEDSGAGVTAEEEGPSGEVPEGGGGDGLDQDDPAGGTEATAADGGGDAPELASRPDEVRASQVAACEASVRSALPDAGALLLTGTATVDGAPALVYGFAAPSARPTVLVALVAVDGCRTITFQAHARD